MNIELILIGVFLFLLFLMVHTYVLYPVIISLFSTVKKNIAKNGNYYPPVSILCSAYNEEKVIRERISNIAALDYDLSKVEVIIGSDCSDDKTNEILRELQEKYNWLKVRAFSSRRGKAAVINDLVKLASKEILVFTDANTEFDKSALKKLTSHFSDPSTGGVSGRLVLVEPESNRLESVEEKKYWEYETIIKKAEGNCGILIGANGGIFAIRKDLFREIPTAKAVTDDFFVTLAVLDEGWKFRYEYDAFAFEKVGHSVEMEVRRKIRFAATNYQTLYFFRNLLFNKNLLLSYAFWSHKVIRWFLPFLMIFCLLANFLLLGAGMFFIITAALQTAFYLMGATGYIFSLMKIRISVFSMPYFFIVANGALLLGFYRFLRGRHSIIWQSTSR